jgi:hypothetical protein
LKLDIGRARQANPLLIVVLLAGVVAVAVIEVGRTREG